MQEHHCTKKLKFTHTSAIYTRLFTSPERHRLWQRSLWLGVFFQLAHDKLPVTASTSLRFYPLSTLPQVPTPRTFFYSTYQSITSDNSSSLPHGLHTLKTTLLLITSNPSCNMFHLTHSFTSLLFSFTHGIFFIRHKYTELDYFQLRFHLSTQELDE